MSNKHRIFNEKFSRCLRYPVLVVFLALGSFVSTVDAAVVTPTPTPDPMGCAVDVSLKTKGCWANAFGTGPVVHASVLPDGRTLHWSSYGPHGYPRTWACSLIGDPDKKLCDRDTPIQDIYTDANFTNKNFNIFCSGHSLLADGRVLIAGGAAQAPPEIAESRSLIYNFNPAAGQPAWVLGPTMYEGRWYPTDIALGSGGTLTASGTYYDETTSQTVANNFPEVLPAGGSAWTKLTGAGDVGLPLYPWLYWASNGKVFYAGPTSQGRWLDVSGTGDWLPLGSQIPDPLESSTYRESGSSVMYDVDKVMISGGGPVAPVATNDIIDLSVQTPDWQPAAPMAFARKHHNLTILADGTILATGGTKGMGFNNTCDRHVVYEAEIWTPSTNTWATMGRMSHNRRYHSTAWLLRDGRVMVGGSDGYPSTTVQCTPALPPVYQTEIFTPPYLFDSNGNLAPRPVVNTMPAPPSGEMNSLMSYGSSSFTVKMGDSTTISKVTLIRLSSVTHSFNMNQRINYLPVQQSGSTLTLTAPASSNVAPPGHYLLFVINSSGVPSVAEIVRVG